MCWIGGAVKSVLLVFVKVGNVTECEMCVYPGGVGMCMLWCWEWFVSLVVLDRDVRIFHRASWCVLRFQAFCRVSDIEGDYPVASYWHGPTSLSTVPWMPGALAGLFLLWRSRLGSASNRCIWYLTTLSIRPLTVILRHPPRQSKWGLLCTSLQCRIPVHVCGELLPVDIGTMVWQVIGIGCPWMYAYLIQYVDHINQKQKAPTPSFVRFIVVFLLFFCLFFFPSGFENVWVRFWVRSHPIPTISSPDLDSTTQLLQLCPREKEGERESKFFYGIMFECLVCEFYLYYFFVFFFL